MGCDTTHAALSALKLGRQDESDEGRLVAGVKVGFAGREGRPSGFLGESLEAGRG